MFRFAHPEILYLLLIVPALIAVYIIYRHRRERALAAWGDNRLLHELMPLRSRGRSTWKFALLMTALILTMIGAAGPQFGSKLEQVKKEGVELIIALDVSNSMNTQDIQPSRLEAAKQAIYRLVDKMGNDKVGLIVFAGDAYVQLPITTDYASAKLFLSNITTGSVPIQGTAIGQAIKLAVKSFPPESEASRAIIIITDGENHEDDAIAAAKAAREQGITIHTIGMGLPQGGPIPSMETEGEYIKDGKGEVVISKLDETMLQRIAQAGEGSFIRATNASVGLATLMEEIQRMDKTLLEERVYSDFDEKYYYFLWMALFLLVVEFLLPERKNKLLMKINLFGENDENK